jgi:hypothetical protein
MSRIVKIAGALGNFITEVDGSVVYWPIRGTGGAYKAHHLRELADELDRRNVAWEAQHEAFCEKLREKDHST